MKIDAAMQEYFNFNIASYKKVLADPNAQLMEKFKAENCIFILQHAQRRLDSLQYEASKEVADEQ